MTRAAYNDPEHRAAVAELRRHPQPCWRRCGRMATTIDHVPALALHHHVRGSGCCVGVPACRVCNYGAGALVARARRTRRPTRPGASRQW